MEVSQFTYFQQVGGIDCDPVSGELTYGLERLAMYVQGVDNVYDLDFNGRTGADKVTYGDVFLQAEQEYSRFNFEYADTEHAARPFPRRRGRVQGAARQGRWGREASHGAAGLRPGIKATHLFNLLDARGVISVTERQAYIGRVRELAKRLLRGVAQELLAAARMAELLLELFSEEIPARMQERAAEDLARLLGEA